MNAVALATPIISFREVSKTFRGKTGDVKAVDLVTFDIEAGEVFGVIGHSGAGKSTLVRLINALEVADSDSGGLFVAGREVPGLAERELRALRSQIGMIFQQFNLLTARTVADNVGYPLAIAGWPKARRAQRVAELLEFTSISDKAGAYPSQLSGGQKQRVGIARALAAHPQILLADEATSALDPQTTRDVLDLLVKANREFGVTIVLISHVMTVIQYLCSRTAVIDGGKIVELGDTFDVFARPKHPVTRRFVQASLHDRPTGAAIGRLRARHRGRLVHVVVDDGAGLDISAITSGTSVRAGVVFGSLTEVDGRPFGSITLELTSDDGGAEEAIARMRNAGAKVTDLGAADAPIADPSWDGGAGEGAGR